MALWLYATIDGVGRAQALERLTRELDASRWICGGVRVNHRKLSDFRVEQVEFLNRVLPGHRDENVIGRRFRRWEAGCHKGPFSDVALGSAD
jgi:hypothetical protein